MYLIGFRRSLLLLFLLLVPNPVAAQEGGRSDEVAVARGVVDLLQAYVREHSQVASHRPLVFDLGQPGIQPRSGKLVPFTREEIEPTARGAGWRIGTLDEWLVCGDSPGTCRRLRDNVILASISRPSIEGGRAVVAVSWYHNARGMVRYNARVLELTRDGSGWRLTDVLDCAHTVGGGPCDMTFP